MQPPSAASKRPLFSACKTVLLGTLRHFQRVEGDAQSAAFAYYGFFSLFPLILLLIAGGSFLLGSEQAATEIVLEVVENQIPLKGTDRNAIAATVIEVSKARGSVTIVAVVILLWGSLRFFQSPIRTVNRIWECEEYNWWSLPFKNLMMVLILVGVVILGVLLPIFVDAFSKLESILPWLHLPAILALARALIAPLCQFIGLLLFFKLAPRRRRSFRETWLAALSVTIGMQLLQWGLVIYVYHMANFGKLYGPFAVAIVIMLWIYLSGTVLLFGACLSRALHDFCSGSGKVQKMRVREKN